MELEKKCVKYVCRNPINTIGHRDTGPLSNENWSRLITKTMYTKVASNYWTAEKRKVRPCPGTWDQTCFL